MLLKVLTKRKGFFEITSPNFSYLDHNGSSRQVLSMRWQIEVEAKDDGRHDERHGERHFRVDTNSGAYGKPIRRKSIVPPPSPPDGVTRILFLSADPTDQSRVRVTKELNDIDAALRNATDRAKFKLRSSMAATTKDIVREILQFQPRIVHFSGHGTSGGEICLEKPDGTTHRVSPEALASLFKAVSNEVACVVLNACFSTVQAVAVAEHIAYVIGMESAIDDGAAIAFSAGFYQALCEKRSIEKSFEFGTVQMQLEYPELPDYLYPKLI